ncbi:MAG: slipin family protein [Deltaproteobacteria bacterium]|nr:slipin family protein [Deltaproteobacteria bacterium]
MGFPPRAGIEGRGQGPNRGGQRNEGHGQENIRRRYVLCIFIIVYYTKDNVSVKVSAVVYFRVVDANKAVVAVEDYMFATSQMAQTTLRSVLGQTELDGLLSEREKINHTLQDIIDRQTEPWGIKVANVEVKHIDLPQEMQRAMAKQAEAERERRAKVIRAEGEFQSAAKLVEAAKMMENNPMSLQMRYLQTLVEVSSEKNSTTIFPIPIDLLSPFIKKG